MGGRVLAIDLQGKPCELVLLDDGFDVVHEVVGDAETTVGWVDADVEDEAAVLA